LLTCCCPFVEIFLMHGFGLVSLGAMGALATKLLRTKSTHNFESRGAVWWH
jgi:hypothetical protein